MIKVGQKVSFDPFIGVRCAGMSYISYPVIGTVSYVNTKHKWFSVEYDLEGTKQRASFKFSELGDRFKIVRV